MCCAPRKVGASEGDPEARQLLVLGGGWAKKDVAQVSGLQEEFSISHLCVLNCDSPEELVPSFSLLGTHMKGL